MPRRTLDLAIVIAIALAANFTYFHFGTDYFFPDSKTYLAPAENMLRGLGFVAPPGVPETFRTPGYPLFLLLFLALKLNAAAIVVVQHLMNASLAVAVYLLTQRLGGDRIAAMTAAIVFALDIPSIHHSNKVLSETLFTCVLLAAFALVLRMARHGTTIRGATACGVLLGALVMIRPVAIAFAFVVAAFLLLRIRRAHVAIVLAIAVAIPIAWGFRNRHETGVFTIASVAGTNMILHRAAAAIAMENDEHEFKVDLRNAQAELQEETDDFIVESEKVRELREVSPAVRGTYYSRIGRQIALQHPRGLALVMLRGLAINFFDSDWESVMIVSTIPAAVLDRTLPAIPPIVAALALIGLFAIGRRDLALALFIAVSTFYFLFMSAGSEAEARFRVPVAPLIAIAAGIGVETARRGLRDTRPQD